MPYADPDRQKEYMRQRYRDRYADPKFAAKERKRKAAFYEDNPSYKERLIRGVYKRRGKAFYKRTPKAA
jgi:hypothetical protein